MSVDCVILAGGSSSRFSSPFPKIFYPFINKPIIEHLLDQLSLFSFSRTIVVTGTRTHDYFLPYEEKKILTRALQKEPRGTWDALKTALPLLESSECLIINGDMPLLSYSVFEKILKSKALFSLVSTITPYPRGYGRIIRDQRGAFEAIVEDCELKPDQQVFNEVNAGLYKFNTEYLDKISVVENQKIGEFYLTDLWKKDSPILIETEIIFESDYRLLTGINSWQDFEQAEFFYYQLQRERLVKQGAFLKGAQSIYIQGDVNCESSVIIEGPCCLEGPLVLGKDIQIKPYTRLSGSVIKENTCIDSFSLINQSEMGTDCVLGPFLKATQQTVIESFVSLGSFVEAKRSFISRGTKAKHFSYIADATIGTYCNLGAFVVFCNYDGEKKHTSILGNNVFVGSGSQVVSPVMLNDNSYVGAGTTVTKNVTAGSLMTRRASIKITENWSRRKACVES
jgi:bifunctional UDP-N-acetylglucosamine pyrophosphorylase/glucosamine-1-phosphate N-acetyltransferase